MRRKKKNPLVAVLAVLLPVLAAGSAVTASVLWYRAHSGVNPRMERLEKTRVKEVRPSAPEEFSAGLAEGLPAFLADYGVGKKEFRKGTPDSSSVGIQAVYTANIPSSVSPTLLHLKLRDWVESRGGKVLDAVESADGLTLTLTLGARTTATDVLRLRKTPGMEVREAVMAVIVDDLGIRDSASARRLSRLGVTVTFSILPFRKNTGEVVGLAVESGTPFMLHMPMEPKSSTENPGEGAILSGDSDEVVRRKLERAFGSVRGATGMNNHMGSRATEDQRVMETVMRYLQQEGGFFVDSRTSNQSVAYAVSQRVKVRSAVMTGYLDVIDERGTIRNRLRELARMSLDGTPVIVIGHDRPATVDVIERELPALAREGIRFVGVEELVK